MSPQLLKDMPVVELVNQFTEITSRQYDAALFGNITKYNSLVDQMLAVADELKSRPGDQRSALVPLLVHPNRQVRLMAAEFTLGLAPVASRQTLQELSDAKVYPQSAYAMGTLRALQRGDRKPT
ncbi:MAG TPA: DUF2019 domain-containing protein [Pseudolabrys sp.]|uniref:DUF2019 domain-containing protein n=1 Tax=Pseudolabrys sp. TaxID=1960880 RepID=UPI002DDCB321|nr:DUF2019 domain-containing protein [Pseudolabrys sp.]HEV2629396.1 DUF2019 domain-containing protein [Pseudolabrys sp.]